MRDVDFTGFTAPHRFLTRNGVLISFCVVWAACAMMLEFASTVPPRENADNSVLNYDDAIGVMTVTPMVSMFGTLGIQDGE